MNLLGAVLIFIISVAVIVATFTTVMNLGGETETAALPTATAVGDGKPDVTTSIRGAIDGAERQSRGASEQGLADRKTQVELAHAFKIAAGREPTSEDEIARSLRVLDQAGQAGDAKALQVYADALHKGNGVKADPLGALQYYERSLALGNAGAGITLSLILAKGNGVAKDTTAAIGYLERSMALNESSAGLKLLGDLYAERDRPRFETARSYYERAMRQGNEGAAVALGNYALRGQATGDFAEAERYFRAALDLGSTRALKLLADTYYAKRNPARDVSRAADYYRDAALTGDESGAISLARMYIRGELEGERRDDVADLLAPLADGARQREVTKLLGDVFSLAGPGRNMRRAVQSYERAGMLGDGWAFLALGDLVRQGEPDAVALGSASAHYQKAADQGVARAYVRLGDLAWKESAAQPDSNALFYYSLAEAAGDPIGTLRLARAEQSSYQQPGHIKSAAARYRLALQEVGSVETIRHLRSGDKRGLVGIVQYLLGSTGYDTGSIDGIVGSKTISALGQFCAEHGLRECKAELEDAPLEALLKIGSFEKPIGEPRVRVQ
jgi:uncharacterized protein